MRKVLAAAALTAALFVTAEGTALAGPHHPPGDVTLKWHRAGCWQLSIAPDPADGYPYLTCVAESTYRAIGWGDHYPGD